jgi:predicted nucleic acid-binding protein
MGLSSYCLDASAYSHFRRGDQEVVALVDGAARVAVPAIVLGELRAGFRSGSQRERNERELQAFLAHSAVDVLVVGASVSEHYADIVADLRQRGTPLPTNDIWIAATAASSGLIVLTYDEHFEAISRVGSVILSEASR